MKLSGSNFQAWPEFSLEIDGLTVITGDSSQGKSSLFRALQGILRNELSERYVRNKQKAPLELTLEYGAHVIKASRARDGSARYVIDGEKFDKLAQAVPKELKDLGFNEIKVGEFEVDPIFATQNEPQFLLDKRAYSPGKLNAILGAFGGTEKLELGKKDANLQITQKNGEAKTLSFEIADAHNRAAALETVTAESTAITNEIHTLESSARSLEARAYWMTLTHQRRSRLSTLSSVLDSLAVPDTTEVSNLQNKVTNLYIISRNLGNVARLRAQEKILGDITTGWSGVVTLYKQSRALRETEPLWWENQQSTRLADATDMNSVIKQLEDISYTANRLQASISYIGNVQQLRARVAELQHERTHIEAEQNAASLVKCPQCGTEF